MRNALRAMGAALTCLAVAASARAEEGMWTFDNFPAARMQEEVGWAPDRAWLDRVMGATMRLPACSGANVGAEGLVLTNQHCVVACLNQASNAERDLVANGFAARARRAEIACSGLAVQLLETITDVTAQIETAAAGAPAERFAAVRDAEIARISGACGSAGRRCEVVALYHGGRYALYRYRRFEDVRLVFAPEYAAAQFGGDADNFSFPRTSVDFALLRVYERGAPARTPGRLHLRFTPPEAGEVVLAAGNPGPTSRQRTVAELAFERDVFAPWREAALEDTRVRLAAYAARGAAESQRAIETLETTANNAQAYAGRRRALADAAGLAQVNAAEADLRARVARNRASQREAGEAWAEIERAHTAYRSFFFAYQYAELRAGERSNLFAWARDIVRGAAERAKPEAERMPRYASSMRDQITRWVETPRPAHADWEAINLEIWLSQLARYLPAENSALARQILGDETPEALAQRLSASRLADPAYRTILWRGGAEAVAASDDPMIVYVRGWDEAARAVRMRYQNEVEAPAARAHERIARVRYRAFGESIYPDSTFSPRLSYGHVAGWSEEGREIGPFTFVRDLYARADSGGAYQLPPAWRAARPRLDPDLVMNFTSDTDIISGNSGSALLDREGRVVGVVFDGNRHALGGEYYYNAARNRTVSLSSALIGATLSLYRLDAVRAEME